MDGVVGNLFALLPSGGDAEQTTELVANENLRIERIVSTGQASPLGFWYDQDWTEWVLLLAGAAGLLFEGEAEPCVLRPGDHVLIPAHRRHRVAWTDPAHPTVWVAVHYPDVKGASKSIG